MVKLGRVVTNLDASACIIYMSQMSFKSHTRGPVSPPVVPETNQKSTSQASRELVSHERTALFEQVVMEILGVKYVIIINSLYVYIHILYFMVPFKWK